MHLAYAFPGRRDRYGTIVIAFSHVSLLAFGEDHPNLPIFRFHSRTTDHLTHRIQPRTPSLLKVLSISGRISSRKQSGPVVDQAPGGMTTRSCLGMERAELSEFAENRQVFRVLLGLLCPRPS